MPKLNLPDLRPSCFLYRLSRVGQPDAAPRRRPGRRTTPYPRTTISPLAFLGRGCFLVLLTFIAFGSPERLKSQTTVVPVPGPIAKRCGASLPRSVVAPSSYALSLLKEAVSVMDSTAAYQSIKQFAISGTLSDFSRSTKSSTEVGTFQIQENHSVPNGDFSRDFVVNGASSSLTRTAGQIVSTAGYGETPNGTKLAFMPKSFAFPLAVLEDELQNPKVVAISISARPGPTQNGGLASLQHIRIQNLTDAKSSVFETEDWYFDLQSHLPVLVGHELPTENSPSSCIQVFTHFGKYRNLSGALVPTSIYTERGSSSVRTMTVQTLTY